MVRDTNLVQKRGVFEEHLYLSQYSLVVLVSNCKPINKTETRSTGIRYVRNGCSIQKEICFNPRLLWDFRYKEKITVKRKRNSNMINNML